MEQAQLPSKPPRALSLRGNPLVDIRAVSDMVRCRTYLQGDQIGERIFRWRSLQWWQEQKDGDIHIQHAKHFNAYNIGIDRQLSDTAGRTGSKLLEIGKPGQPLKLPSSPSTMFRGVEQWQTEQHNQPSP